MKTEEQLNQDRESFKASVGKFNEIQVFLDEEDETKTATVFLKKPDGKSRSLVSTLITDKKFNKAVEAFLRNRYLGGDDLDVILSNDYAMASVEESIVEMLHVRKSILKKN